MIPRLPYDQSQLRAISKRKKTDNSRDELEESFKFLSDNVLFWGIITLVT